jgi:hypothetical protein
LDGARREASEKLGWYGTAGVFDPFIITRDKRQGEWVNLCPNGGSNKNAWKYTKPEILRATPTSPENVNRSVWMNSQWWADNEAKMFEIWNEWMLKK